MKSKILTVDDSRTVHILVKKAFKECEVDILQAANGVEGLSVAAKELPNLILLDVTMPVMDGIEMLTRLKGDPALKQIPVIMLTAEGGRDAVMKIAKMGIRDYMVKPFKDDVLLDKVGRIVDLNKKVIEKTILDDINILLVEDKPAIIQTVQDGLKHLPWSFVTAGSAAEALNSYNDAQFDLVLMSLSLPQDSAFELVKQIQTVRKKTPIVGMVVKSDSDRQHRAVQSGFDGTITKPLDMGELEMRSCRAMGIDTSPRYFKFEKGYLLVILPQIDSMSRLGEIRSFVSRKVTDAVDSGYHKVVIDGTGIKELDVNLIKLIIDITNAANDMSLKCTIVGNETMRSEGNNFQESKSWKVYDSIEEAIAE
jgi:two-component system, cell cycle response regulator